MTMNINDNTNIVKAPEGCFKQNVIDGYGLSKVVADILRNYLLKFVKNIFIFKVY